MYKFASFQKKLIIFLVPKPSFYSMSCPSSNEWGLVKNQNITRLFMHVQDLVCHWSHSWKQLSCCSLNFQKKVILRLKLIVKNFSLKDLVLQMKAQSYNMEYQTILLLYMCFPTCRWNLSKVLSYCSDEISWSITFYLSTACLDSC